MKTPECYVEWQYWPAKRGERKATLVISLDELEAALNELELALADVPARLLGLELLGRAAISGHRGQGDDDALKELEERVGVVRLPREGG